MSFILTTIAQEKKRMEYMLSRYQEQYNQLPKGTISEKVVNGKPYYYLKYREGKKVVSRYVGKSDIEFIRAQVEKRRHIEVMMKSLQEELAIAKKLLEE